MAGPLTAMQVITKGKDTYDAVIVGSGATGGWVAKVLAEAGMQVALLEAGHRTTEAEFTEHLRPYDLKYRGYSPEIRRNRPIQSMKYACRESNYRWFVDDIRNPYTYPDDKPFQWTRGRLLGGRTLTWGRQSYRLSKIDFAAASHDGYGSDWPVTYEEMVPYYEAVERYVGISGEPLGLMQFPDSVMQPPMGMTCGEKHFRDKINARFGRNVTIGRAAVLTQPLNGRQACHSCGPCEHGCITHSYFASPWTTVADAEKSGNCSVVTNAVVSHVTTDRDTGLANGVAYIDRVTRAAREARAKIVVLSASSLESTRILLNSGEGFCNSSGVLGHYVMDHMFGGVSGVLPVSEDPKWVGPPQRPNGLYLPRYMNVDRPHTQGMIRGFGAQMRNASFYGSPAAISRIPGFGASFKRAVVDSKDSRRFFIGTSSECLARYENYIQLDPEVKDAWGIPALRMNVTWGDNEMRLFRHSADEGEEMLRAAGAEDIQKITKPRWPGGATHEVGSARMGNDPRKSVLNRWNQAHDLKNLFITDGAGFVSIGCVNPTLTMMALAKRAADHIVDTARRGEVA
ncbi:MAG: GMC family oxidoreductase [Bryobacterales bacterium]|nr:GMC family oxidoreductase [Bryobacterales bacterium]